MIISLAQLNPKVGDFEGNLKKALDTLENVSAHKPDLVVLPELYLMGYPPLDLLERSWFVQRQLDALDRLAAATDRYPETGVVVGAALPSKKSPGRGLYNAAVLLYQGRIVFSRPKTLLPTYDVFDELRYFDAAESVKTAPFKGEVLGLSVCEDLWNDPDLWPQGRLYDCDPLADLVDAGATILINVSASPFSLGKESLRRDLVAAHARRRGRPVVMVNQVGGNDELIFDGHSLAVDARGADVYAAPGFVEDVRSIDLAQPADRVEFAETERIEALHGALVLGLGDYLSKTGFSKAVIGLSGGIDSAVTCCLAAAALGPENVTGITMPSMFSSAGSVEDSRVLAENLGVDFRQVPITQIYQSYVDELGPHFEGLAPDLAEENIQARIRGNILMAFSNKFGGLVLATGNKSELAMGYCTLYGDMAGGLAVLADVPKITVYELAAHINRRGEIIPRNIIEKAPSAELRPDQKDEDSLPPYTLLDQVLHLFVEEGLSSEEIAARGFDEEVVRRVVGAINGNEFKRRQAPPGLKVTSKAFGTGRRMPIVARHDV